MKPIHTYTSHTTFDLTECKVHCLRNEDGTRRIVAMIPKAVEAGHAQEMQGSNGKFVMMRPFLVTEWEEVTLAVIPPGIVTTTERKD